MESETSTEEQAIIDNLQSVRSELRHYPTPIAGCDEHFNFLLSERGRLTQELKNYRTSVRDILEA